jgi:site-specific recombinase XerD
MPKSPSFLTTDSDDEALVLSGLISFLVHQTPSLETLGREELKQVAKAVVFDSLKDDLKQRVELEKINYADKRIAFLARASKRSIATFKTYSVALSALEAWAERKGLQVLEMKFKDADAFIDSLEGASSSIRLKVAACSSFFTFLDRETEGRIRNPFRGTKARPKRKTSEPIVPTIEEIEIIRESVAPAIQAAITAMVEHGLRVGALASLTIWDGRYKAFSKGKEISGTISETSIKAIKKAGLDAKKPFAGLSEDGVRNAFRYASGKLYKAGKIKAAYSVHDLRHYFAINEYRKDKDIYRLKILLGHASIQVTETYLQGVERYWG